MYPLDLAAALGVVDGVIDRGSATSRIGGSKRLASIGRASIGRASIGRASIGRASVGRASAGNVRAVGNTFIVLVHVVLLRDASSSTTYPIPARVYEEHAYAGGPSVSGGS
jgi:hypothetical protein